MFPNFEKFYLSLKIIALTMTLIWKAIIVNNNSNDHESVRKSMKDLLPCTSSPYFHCTYSHFTFPVRFSFLGHLLDETAINTAYYHVAAVDPNFAMYICYFLLWRDLSKLYEMYLSHLILVVTRFLRCLSLVNDNYIAHTYLMVNFIFY